MKRIKGAHWQTGDGRHVWILLNINTNRWHWEPHEWRNGHAAIEQYSLSFEAEGDAAQAAELNSGITDDAIAVSSR